MRTCSARNLFFIISIHASFSCEASAEIKDANIYPEVSLPQGNLRGINIVTNHKRVIHGFVGIPFAQPPIGNLRFSAPLPAAAWNGTLNATKDANMCPQVRRDRVAGEEDCLYLNVYTPKLPSTDSQPLPVMVWIYSGAFSRGSGDLTEEHPKYILDKDVILVVPNYRLGPLGFFSTGDEVSPGNYGLKDQVLALKWVQTNIQYFGGDPGKVTLFGLSSGSASTDLLILSDLAAGLFHKCIKMSGSSTSLRAYAPRNILVRDSYRLGEHLGCPNTTSTALVNCLRELNASQIADTTSLFLEWDKYPDIIWRPTDEPDAEGAFLTDSPANLYAAGKVRDISCISGLTADEGLYYTSRFYKNPDIFDEFLANVDDILPYILLYYDHEDVSAYTAAVKAFYLNDLTADREVLLANLTQLVGDVYYIYPTYSTHLKQFALGKSPQYLYSFEYLRTVKNDNDTMVAKGIKHADDEMFIYLLWCDEFELCELSEADSKMIDILVELWTSFASSGIPTQTWNEAVTWRRYSSEDNYLRIGDGSDLTLAEKHSYLTERMQFWDTLQHTLDSGKPDVPSYISNKDQ